MHRIPAWRGSAYGTLTIVNSRQPIQRDVWGFIGRRVTESEAGKKDVKDSFHSEDEKRSEIFSKKLKIESEKLDFAV